MTSRTSVEHLSSGGGLQPERLLFHTSANVAYAVLPATWPPSPDTLLALVAITTGRTWTAFSQPRHKAKMPGPVPGSPGTSDPDDGPKLSRPAQLPGLPGAAGRFPGTPMRKTRFVPVTPIRCGSSR
jgi:hypothetical protein